MTGAPARALADDERWRCRPTARSRSLYARHGFVVPGDEILLRRITAPS